MTAPADLRNHPEIADFLRRLQAGEHLLMLALGDSNTNNTGYTNGGKQWPEHLHSRLKDHYKTQKLLLLNSGVSGDTVEDVLARFDTDVARFRPDMTILCIGSNDANKLPLARYQEGLSELIKRLRVIGSRILLRTPTPIWQCDKGYSRIWPEDVKQQAVVEHIRAFAKAHDLPLVDTNQYWRDLEAAGKLPLWELMTDQVHTNAKGHRLVAEELFPAFGIDDEA